MLTCVVLWLYHGASKALDDVWIAAQMTKISGTLWANTVQLALHHVSAAFTSLSTYLTFPCLTEGIEVGAHPVC